MRGIIPLRQKNYRINSILRGGDSSMKEKICNIIIKCSLYKMKNNKRVKKDREYKYLDNYICKAPIINNY